MGSNNSEARLRTRVQEKSMGWTNRPIKEASWREEIATPSKTIDILLAILRMVSGSNRVLTETVGDRSPSPVIPSCL